MKKKSKTKTLVVEYAPRKEASRTLKLREYFTKLIDGFTDINYINLCQNTPTLMDQARMDAYYKRNYNKQQLSSKETSLLKEMDLNRDQLLSADFLILSSPMYNFGYPAPVKAWIDQVMQKGYAYSTDEHGHQPMLQRLKVLVIYTSGITFDQINENEDWNGLVSEGARLFEYMGASEVRIVHVQGTDMLPEKNVKFRTNEIAQKKLNGLAKKWFNSDLNLPTYSF